MHYGRQSGMPLCTELSVVQRAARAVPGVQLTDEAHGDNPMEASTREEKQITDTDFYTRK